MTRIGAQQPYFLPDFYYFYKIYKSELFLVADHLRYRKQSPISRCRLSMVPGNQYLSIPVQHQAEPHPRLGSVNIDMDRGWKLTHLRTLEARFKKTPYFDEYFPLLEELYDKRHTRLTDFLKDIILWHIDMLFPSKTVVFSTLININGETDLQKWFMETQQPVWQIYPDEEPYYRAHFGQQTYRILIPPKDIAFPQGYHPELPLLVLLFLRGQESIIYFD